MGWVARPFGVGAGFLIAFGPKWGCFEVQKPLRKKDTLRSGVAQPPHGSADPERGFGGAEGTRAEASDSPPDLIHQRPRRTQRAQMDEHVFGKTSC